MGVHVTGFSSVRGVSSSVATTSAPHFCLRKAASGRARHGRPFADAPKIHTIVAQSREVLIEHQNIATLICRKKSCTSAGLLKAGDGPLEVVPQAEPPFLEAIQADLVVCSQLRSQIFGDRRRGTRLLQHRQTNR